MITCSRCGNIIPGGQPNCQYCGMPVMNRGEYGANAGKTNPNQPELPAWLQSLRAGTQPTYTTGGNTNFSASDLVEEGALPRWMQPGQPDASQGLTGPHPALRPSSMSAPDTDGAVFPAGNMSAGSLIDEQSLPTWMREQPGDQQGMAAASLIQPDALPAWLREPQSGQAQPQSARPTQQAQPLPQAPMQLGQPQTPPAIMSVPPSSSWASAPQGQPVSSQPFPFPSAQGQAPQPQAQTQPPQQTQMPSMFPAQGLSGQDLIDPQSLPAWLANQPGQPGQPGAAANGRNLSASSLLDMNALPPWLRENGQASQQGPMNMQGPMAPPATSMPQQPPAAGSNLAAASFIDMNALPDWLRASGDGQPGSGTMTGQPASGNMPRAENMRVPGRPRGGVGPQESSAAAANVFASMLGVSSNAPLLPGQQQGSGPQQPPFQLSQPMPPPNGAMPGQIQGQAPGQPPMQGMMPPAYAPQTQTQGYPGSMPGYGPQGYQAGPQGQQGQLAYQTGYAQGIQPGVSQPPANQNMPASSAQPVQSGQFGQPAQGEPTRPAKATKRGFLDTIREWFGLNS